MYAPILLIAFLGCLASCLQQDPPTPVCDQRVDVGYILDISSSISAQEWVFVKGFYDGLTNAFNIAPDRTRVGIVTFETNAETRIDLDDCADAQCVLDEIDALMHATRATTNIAAGLRLTYEEVFAPGRGNRSDVPDVCILFSDGEANEDTGNTQPNGMELRNRGCRIIAVGIDGADAVELGGLASSPSDLFIIPGNDFNDLLALVEPVAQGTCGGLPTCDCVNLPSYGKRKRRYVQAREL